MQFIRIVGLSIFLTALFLFISLLFVSDYTLTKEIFEKKVKAEHQEQLLPQFEKIFDKNYTTTFAFANEIKNTVENVNAEARAQQQWDKVIYDDYVGSLTKASTQGIIVDNTLLLFLLIFVGGTVGALLFILPKISLEKPGIKHNNIFHHALNNRGWIGILLGTLLILFYILLYFYDAYVTNWIILVEPLKKLINPTGDSSQWFLYGFLYTFAVIVMGIRMLIKYRHSNYQMVRTGSVMFFQLAIAFLLPEILVRLNQPYFDFKNMWPLDYDFFDAWHINMLTASGGSVGLFMFVWGITLFVIGVPVFVYFFGKRWYCSWVCGCGGLAETAGDSFRQLSDKSLKAWKIERWLIHAVLIFAVVMTGAVIYNFMTGTNSIFGIDTYTYLRKPYGFFVGAIFSGVVGTGFYPLMGNRVWCRFSCPLAAYLGFVQRFKSRFRITTNGGQCISCGNCSTYCEMGIDVRWYAQRGQNIVRSSCVGCGVCSSVCPRGVLNLEVKEEDGRFGNPILIGNNGITLQK